MAKSIHGHILSLSSSRIRHRALDDFCGRNQDNFPRKIVFTVLDLEKSTIPVTNFDIDIPVAQDVEDTIIRGMRDFTDIIIVILTSGLFILSKAAKRGYYNTVIIFLFHQSELDSRMQ